MNNSYTDVIRRDEARAAYEQWQWNQAIEGTTGIPLWDHLSEDHKAKFHLMFAEAIVEVLTDENEH